MHMLMLGSDWYGGHKSNLQVKQERILGHEPMHDGHDTKLHSHVLFHWDLERVASCVVCAISCPGLCVRVRGVQLVVYYYYVLYSVWIGLPLHARHPSCYV